MRLRFERPASGPSRRRSARVQGGPRASGLGRRAGRGGPRGLARVGGQRSRRCPCCRAIACASSPTGPAPGGRPARLAPPLARAPPASEPRRCSCAGTTATCRRPSVRSASARDRPTGCHSRPPPRSISPARCTRTVGRPPWSSARSPRGRPVRASLLPGRRSRRGEPSAWTSRRPPGGRRGCLGPRVAPTAARGAGGGSSARRLTWPAARPGRRPPGGVSARPGAAARGSSLAPGRHPARPCTGTCAPAPAAAPFAVQRSGRSGRGPPLEATARPAGRFHGWPHRDPRVLARQGVSHRSRRAHEAVQAPGTGGHGPLAVARASGRERSGTAVALPSRRCAVGPRAKCLGHAAGLGAPWGSVGGCLPVRGRAGRTGGAPAGVGRRAVDGQPTDDGGRPEGHGEGHRLEGGGGDGRAPELCRWTDRKRHPHPRAGEGRARRQRALDDRAADGGAVAAELRPLMRAATQPGHGTGSVTRMHDGVDEAFVVWFVRGRGGVRRMAGLRGAPATSSSLDGAPPGARHRG
jgi:hypothetical protein